MYTVEFTVHAEKQFSKLLPNVQQRIVSTLERLYFRPHKHLVKLVGAAAYKLRVDDYRVICTIDFEKKTIFIIKIGHRKSVYD